MPGLGEFKMDKYFIKWSVIWMVINLIIVVTVYNIFGRLDDCYPLVVFPLFYGANTCANEERKEAQ